MMNQINNSSFYHSLMKILSENWNNCLTDNFDFVRFGKPERDIIDAQKNLNEIEHYLDEIESMYFLLEDEIQRNFIEITCI